MNKGLLFAALAVLLCAGCKKTNAAAAENGGDPLPPAADIAALKGTWLFDDPASSNSQPVNDAKAQLGQSLLALFNVKLRFKDGAKYKFSFIGSPVEGHYTIEGNRITLVPETVRGTPVEKISADDNPFLNKEILQKMKGEISADRQTVTFHLTDQLSGSEDNLIFKRQYKAAVPDLLTNQSERNVTGFWEGTLADPSTTSAGAGQELVKAMVSNPELELRQDHTFSISTMGSMEGTWSAQGNNITLIPTKGGRSDLPLSLSISQDSKTLAMTEGYDHITFVREE